MPGHRADHLTRRALLGRGVQAAFLGGPVVTGLQIIGARRRAPVSPSAFVARLLADTKREDVLDVLARAVRARGIAARDVIVGVHRAAARRVIPTRYLGSEFHALMIAYPFAVTARMLSSGRRWEPVLLAVDYYKKIEALHLGRGRATTLPELRAPTETDPERARAALVRALDDWDLEAADAAVPACWRAAGPAGTFDVLFRYGARDLRQIGHKSIHTANTWRVAAMLPAEECAPALRSLVRGILLHEEDNPNGRSSPFDAPWRWSLQAIARFGDRWQRGTVDRTRAFIALLRSETIDSVGDPVLREFARGASPASFWDACSCVAAEILYRWPASIVTLHAVTAIHALRTAYDAATRDQTRRLLVLQAGPRLIGFRNDAYRHLGEPVRPMRIEELDPVGHAKGRAVAMLAADGEAEEKARRMLALAAGRHHGELWERLAPALCSHALDVHDLKHPIAVWEDARRMARPWADRYLALSSLELRVAAGEPVEDHAKHAHKLCRDAGGEARLAGALRTLRG